MKELYAQYVADKSGVWSEASQRSESVRLNKVMHLLNGDAQSLWNELADYHPYSRVTLWTRISAFYKWCLETGKLEGTNPYQLFREKNARLFRNAYQKNPCTEKFEDLMARIEKEPNEAVRNKLKQLLIGGLRYTESTTLKDGHVIGKGNKRRKVFVPEIDGPMAGKDQYAAVLRACKKLGIKGPHKLRSARMTDLVDKGATIFELKKFAGWSNIAVAESYVHARDERIQELTEKRKSESKIKQLMSTILDWAREKVTA